MKRIWRVGLGAATAAFLATAVVAAPGEAAAGATGSAGCTPKTNIEAIIDDSGSMGFTDESRLRVEAMDLLINALSPRTQLGAVEFGSELFEKPAADTVFPPEPVGADAAAMKSALDAAIQADNGATDYNAAFAKADADDPTSQARIFLTDGGHDVGTYNETHLAHNVPTYVIGFGSGLAAPEDQARLQKIAADTGGQLFELEDNSSLQATMTKIEAALTCQTPPREFNDLLKEGQSKTHSVPVGASTKTLQIVLSWTSSLDRFKLAGLRLVVKGKVVAAARPKVRKLQVKKESGQTFLVAKVSGLRKGTLRFAVKAAKIGSGEPKVKLTTQVGRGSGR
ncbi:MAG TPA: VWA domain-containing protein [Solirubrobacterales bacterium]|nr:VWA domain-containing protein [Solirubrobacterales bacterium]